ncbi:hypothetical protein ES707_18536 [subsurface metagenome]
MTIDEAIKILSHTVCYLHPGSNLDEHDAVQLGIEALKAWQEHRRVMGHPKLWILPGETKD